MKKFIDPEKSKTVHLPKIFLLFIFFFDKILNEIYKYLKTTNIKLNFSKNKNTIIIITGNM